MDNGGVKGKIKVAWKLQYSEEDRGGEGICVNGEGSD